MSERAPVMRANTRFDLFTNSMDSVSSWQLLSYKKLALMDIFRLLFLS